MKIVCPREELSRGLQTVLRSVGARAGIPALSGVLVDLTDSELHLTTTDLDMTTRVRLPITGEAGRIVVPARLLADIVRNLPSDEVEIVGENGTVRVAGGRARYGLRSLPAEDFPQLPGSEQAKAIKLDGQTLAKALGQVAPAASRDETRPVLTGVLFEGEGGELRIAATDSYRLAVRTLETPDLGEVRFLVPSKAVVEVARLVPDGEVGLEISGSQVGFQVGEVLLQSRLIEGEFPSYRQLLPQEQPNNFEAPRQELIEALRRVAVLAQDTTPVFFEFEPGGVRISCQAQGLGEAAEEVDAEFSGEPAKVAFNPAYLENGLSAVADERVRIEFSDPQRSALVRGAEDRSFVYLIMPIRVS